MDYAERLPQTRSLLAPVLALAVGAAAATGAYALLDDNDTALKAAAAEVVVIEAPAPSGNGGLELRGSKASQSGTTAPVTGEPGSPGTQYGTAQYRLERP
jgi:hypothetical protein